MSKLLLVLSFLILVGCNSASHKDEKNVIKEALLFGTPSHDSLEKICEIDAKELRRTFKIKNGKNLIRYYLHDSLFSGWACLTDPENDHKYRYTNYKNGELVRQIGYYANETLDHDFEMIDGKGIGSEKMWMADGHPYIEQYYISPGIMDGYQRRWHSNHILAREALFDSGRLVYEKLFDVNGNLLESKGEVPE